MDAVVEAEVADTECAEQGKHQDDAADDGEDRFGHLLTAAGDGAAASMAR